MTVTPFPLQRPTASAQGRNVVAVASGKGGVGKTWFAITLAHAFARSGARVLLFDGDLGLANVDIQLGLMPKQDFGSVLAGRLPLADAALRYDDGGFDIIAGRSGSGRFANVAAGRLQALIDELLSLAHGYDKVIVDVGAGIERTVRQLTRAVGTCIVVATDEPTSLTDAYAFLKVTHLEKPASDLRIVVNLANSGAEGERTYRTLHKACEGFLKFSPPLLGVIRRDLNVREAIRSQTSLLNRYPCSEAAADVERIANKLHAFGESDGASVRRR
jgi:flagellar biosynthesis protein FlhG